MPHQVFRATVLLVVSVMTIVLSGCGGGGSTSIPAASVMETPANMNKALNLPVNHGLSAGRFTIQPGASETHGNVVVSCPVGGSACVVNVAVGGSATYAQTGGRPDVLIAMPEEFPEIPRLHAMQAPILGVEDILHVGADVGSPADELAAIGMHGGVAVFHGRVRDGAGAENIIGYLNGQINLTYGYPGLTTFSVQPTVRLAEGARDEHADYVVRAVQLINAALPRERRILFSDDYAPPLATIEEVPEGEIFINFVPWEDWDFPAKPAAGTFAAYAYTWIQDSRNTKAQIWVDPVYLREEEYTLNLMVHELIHAIGMNGHPDPERFPGSIMSHTDDVMPGHALFPIDREMLLAAYSVLEPGASREQIEDLGPWEETSSHLRGDLQSLGVSFGVASRNGLAQPWASGPMPWTVLSDNLHVSGTVTWSGRLLGFTPALESVGGRADLAVELETLDGQLDFTELEYWAANASPGVVGSGTTWDDGDLQYLLNVQGNTFVQAGGDEGTVTGAFFGAEHEAMGGVLERTDLTAAFGGAR